MALRLIEMVVPEPLGGELQKLLVEQSILELWQIGLREVLVIGSGHHGFHRAWQGRNESLLFQWEA